MYRVVLVLSLLGACDYVFTIKVAPDGASGGDPADGDRGTEQIATGTCPAIGTVPPFSMNPTAIFDHRCKYSESVAADLAVADCVSGTGRLEGPPGGPFTTPLQIDVAAGVTLTDLRITPEGDRLIALASPTSGSSVIDVYTRAGEVWQSPAPLPIAGLQSSDTVGTGSARSGQHVMVSHHDFNPGGFDEYRDLGTGTWDLPHAYTPGTFGLATIGQPSLTPDGKRLVFVGEPSGGSLSIYYSDRASIDDPFTAATSIPVVEQFVFNPFLTADCSRLYFANAFAIEVIAP
jgi:WD40 repeat protein